MFRERGVSPGVGLYVPVCLRTCDVSRQPGGMSLEIGGASQTGDDEATERLSALSPNHPFQADAHCDRRDDNE